MSSEETMILLHTTKKLHLSFAAQMHIAEALLHCSSHAKRRELSYLRYGHMNTNIAHDGTEIYFATKH
jgi:hypothetical protein